MNKSVASRASDLSANLAPLMPWGLGLMFVHMWIYCSTHRPSLSDDISVMVVMYLVLSATLAVTLALTVHKERPSGFLSDKTVARLDVVAGCAMGAGGALLAVGSGLPAAVTAFAASAIGGAGVGWAYLRWCQCYARLDIHLAAPLVFLTMALGSVGKTAIDYMPAVPAAAALLACPALTFWCLRTTTRRLQSRALSPERSDGPANGLQVEPVLRYNPRTLGALGRLALGVAVFSATTGIVQSLLLGNIPSQYHPSVLVHHGTEVVLALAMAAWSGPLGRRLDFNRTWRVVLVLMGTALVFEPYLRPELQGYLLSLVRTAQTFLIVFLFLALADIARHSVYHPMAVFSAGWISYSLPFMAGNVAGSHLAEVGFDTAVLTAGCSWLLVMVTMFVLDQSAAGNHLVFADLNVGPDDDTPASRAAQVQHELDRSALEPDRTGYVGDPLSLRCAMLAAKAGLTPRESEILELLARGRSKVNIAEGFMISENTVRGHAKRIYVKLDVHSRRELLDLVEAEKD